MRRLAAEDLFQTLGERARAARVPEGVTFELSYGCNLRCVHCYNPTHRALPRELTTAEVGSILEQCADLGVASVCFSGGEPLVRPDVLRIFGHAKRLGLLLDLISNATRVTPEIADRLGLLGFRSLAVSIYGATKATYERVTGRPGSYEQFLSGLERLVSRKLPVTVRMPVVIENAHEVGAARALVVGLGVKFQYCLDITPRTDGDPSPLRHRLSPADKLRIDREQRGDDDAWTDEAPCAATDDFLSCACGRTRFAITPYGEMNLCAAFPIPRYDLRTGTVRDGWDVLKQTVDRARPNDRYECPACPVRGRCRQGPSDAWLETGDMSVCLPHFKAWATLETHSRERDRLRCAD